MAVVLAPDHKFDANFGAQEIFLASPSLRASGHCITREGIYIQTLCRI